MVALSRTDTSILGRWWWTIDRWQLLAFLCLIVIGLILTMAATPAVSVRFGYEPYHFIYRQFAFLGIGLIIALGLSFLEERYIRRLALAMLCGSILLLILTPLIGIEKNGAIRWLPVGTFSLQASEFVKPAFAVIAALCFAQWRLDNRFPGPHLAGGLLIFIVILLLIQPDIGQIVVLTTIWGVQFFVAGLPLVFVWLFIILAAFGAIGAYFAFDHVRLRVDQFLDPHAADGSQIGTSLKAFLHGGLFGRGPGEGRVKEKLPDAHADFVFAVMGEEFGLIFCLFLIAVFVFIILRGFSRVMQNDNMFALFAVAGLLTQFGMQALINMASALKLMPTKGMTLPFISYGGSSSIALAIAMGMILSMTRRQRS